MQFPCPSCQALISATFAKPGRFQPKCPKCGNPFQVIIQVGLPGASGSVANPLRKPGAETPDTKTRLSPQAISQRDPQEAFASEPAADPMATFASQTPQDSEAEGTAVHATRPEPRADDFATSAYSSQPDAASSEDTEATGGFIPRNPDATGDFTEAEEPQARPAKKKPSKRTEAESLPDVPDQLGGYEILKTLGQGGMGAVFLARQMSLDRPVALKVINERLATDPVFVARFVREAYAAAQLTHHNVVQIYDIGSESGINYFSMEFVRGGSLGDVLKKAGKLTPKEAVGYILQAARGLKFAHDRGMVHRDIKPDNLMLNTDGIVKVADMGLIKTRGMTASEDRAGSESAGKSLGGSLINSLPDVTNVGSAMGSPAYMAPEQCRDASGVDHRADIYSLGCTLYALLAGRGPFQGKTAIEVINKQIHDPPPPLQSVVRDVPRPLADIVNRSLIKEPENRYQSMDEFIEALKSWQESNQAGPPRPTEEQLTVFEGLVKQLKNQSKSKLSRNVALLGPIAGLLASIVAIFISPILAGGIAVGTLAAVLSGVICTGLLTKSYFFTRLRSWALGARITDWLTLGVGVVLFLLVLYLTGLLGAGLLCLVGGAALGAGYAFLLARPAESARNDLKEEFEKVVKRVRLQGLEEEAVRRFIIETSGDRWEEVYELLFDYEEKLQARVVYADLTRSRPKYAAWRESLLQRLNAAIQARDAARAQKLLLQVEARRLEAEGLSKAEARARAQDAAEDIVGQGAEIRAANLDQKRKVNVRQMMSRYERTRSEPPRKRPNPVVLLTKKILAVPFDPRLRVLLAAIMILGGFLWLRQNATAAVTMASASGDVQSATEAGQKAIGILSALEPIVVRGEGPPLRSSWLPESLAQVFTSLNPIIAGLLLLVSAFSSRTLPVLLASLSAGVTLVGHKFGVVPDVEPLKAVHMTAIAGIGLGVVAILLGRRS